jgi:hypothetical protein
MEPAPDDAMTRHVTQRLSAVFPTVDPRVVVGIVRDTQRHYAGHPTRDSVPMLVEEASRDRLRSHLDSSSRTARPRS